MNNPEFQQLDHILTEIRENQTRQLELQAEALALQRKQFALVQNQAERHEHIQDRAESLQDKGAQIVAVARKTLFIILPIVTLLIIYVSWLLLR